MLNDAILSAVDQQIATQRGIEPPQQPQAQPAAAPTEEAPQRGFFEPDPETGVSGFTAIPQAVNTGINDAVIQTLDFFAGGDAGELWGYREANERVAQGVRDNGPVPSIVHDITQFGAGLVGVGKAVAPIRAVQTMRNSGTAGRVAYEVGQGAAAGFLVMDPHEERLSDLIEQYPALRNPVTDFLASNEDDSTLTGRFKNALEGIGMDLALAGVLEGSLRAIRAFRRGDTETGTAAISEVEQMQAARDLDAEAQQAVETPGSPTQVPEGPGNRPLPLSSNPDVDAQAAVEGAPQITVRLDPEAPRPGNTEAPTIEPVRSEAAAVPLRPQDQQYQPRVQVEEADVDAIISGAREDIAAMRRYGSREAAQQAGHQFSRVNLPWQKINGSADLQALVERTSKTLSDQMDKLKGGRVLSDARVREMVQDSAEMFGQDPDVLMGELANSGDRATTMVADMEAAYVVSRKLFEDTYATAAKIKAGLLDEFNGSLEQANAELTRRFQAAADMMAAGQSMRAAAGRAVRRNRGDFAISPEDVARFKDIPPERLADILNSTGGDIKKLRETAQPGFWRRVTDEGTFLLTNNLLWNWTTHAVNTSTNLYMLAARPAEKMIGSLMQGSAGSPIRRQAMREYAYSLYSIGDAWSGLVDAFLKGDSILSPHTDEYFRQGTRVNVPEISFKGINDTWDLFQNGFMAANFRQMGEAGGKAAGAAYRVGVGAPTRALGAVDEFVKQMRYRSVVQSRASVQGTDAGLRGADLKRHIERELAEAFTPDGRAIDDAALREAQIATFQQELLPGTLGKAVQNFRHNYPPTAFVLPFVKTPINVLRYAVKMTPGLNLAQKEYRQMLSGKMGAEQQAHAMGQMALGSTFMALAAQLALSGRITGSGPQDYELQRQLEATGWQPYSIVYDNPDGTKGYLPIGRFDPVGMPFGMVADIVDMMVTNPGNRRAEEGIAAVGVALASSFSEKTFLMNLNQVITALADPGEGGQNIAKYFGNLGRNMIPGSSAITNYANQDPYLRDARSFMDRIMQGMPGYSETIPPRRDSFGDPIWRRRGLVSSESTDMDIVDSEHNRIINETGFGVRPPSAHHSGVDLRTVTLSDGQNAYDVYQQLVATPGGNTTLREALGRLIQSEGYQRLEDGDPQLQGTKLGAIMDVVRQFREAGKNALLAQYPELRTQFSQSQVDLLSRLRTNSGGRPGGVTQMLTDMGY